MSSAPPGPVDGPAPPLVGLRLLLMGVPNFGLALAIGIVTTVLPVVLSTYTDSSTVVGLIVGGEGLFAIVLPVLVGGWSDRTHTRLGGRLPYILAAAPLAALSLALIPFVGSLWAICICVAAFYVAYFTYYPPYNALYPDLIPPERAGRSQGGQAFWRGLGLAGSVVGGALLIDVWHPLPFIVAASAIVLSTGIFCAAVGKHAARAHERPEHAAEHGATVRAGWQLVREHAAIRNLLIANSLWETSLAALRSFVLLWLVAGLGLDYPTASVGIGVVAGMMVLTSLAVGQVADHFGVRQVMYVAVVFYGFGLLVPGLSTNTLVIGAAMPFVAMGGAVANALPYGLLIATVPGHSHGVAAGLFSVSRGIGVVLGPLTAGALIDGLRPWLGSTDGYQAMWIVVAGTMLLSIPFMRRVRHAALPGDG